VSEAAACNGCKQEPEVSLLTIMAPGWRCLRRVEVSSDKPPFLAASVWQTAQVLFHQRVLLRYRHRIIRNAVETAANAATTRNSFHAGCIELPFPTPNYIANSLWQKSCTTDSLTVAAR